MTPDTLVVFGSGGHAKVVVEAVRARTPDREIILLDDSPEAKNRKLLGITVAGGRELLSGKFKPNSVVPAIGDNSARSALVDWLGSEGHQLETVVHPAAIVGATARIESGSFIAAGAIIIADARVRRGVIINTGASVDHDCDVGEASHIAPGVHLCGNVHVGARALIGVGSSVRPGIRIGCDIMVGAGTVVVKDLVEPGTYAGNPARRLP